MRRAAARALWQGSQASVGDVGRPGRTASTAWAAAVVAASADARGARPAPAAAARPAASRWTAAPALAAQALPHARFARVSAPVTAAVEVRVAAMGESITEGTVAAVLAPPGTAVEEDAVIAQIETDKVTIDVRAPAGGVVQQVLVKPEETVVVGQLIAILGDEALEGTPAAPPAAAGAAIPEKAAPAAAAPPAPVASTAAASATTTTTAHARVPSIHFPPRRTAGGEVISFLPAAAQAAARAAVEGSGSGGRGTAAPPATTTSTPLPPLSQRLAGLGSSSSDTKWYAGKERGVKLAPSRVLSESEIELIESGGAW